MTERAEPRFASGLLMLADISHAEAYDGSGSVSGVILGPPAPA